MRRIAAFRIICACLADQSAEDLQRAATAEGFRWAGVIELAHEYRVSSALAARLRDASHLEAIPKDASIYFDQMALHHGQWLEQLLKPPSLELWDRGMVAVTWPDTRLTG